MFVMNLGVFSSLNNRMQRVFRQARRGFNAVEVAIAVIIVAVLGAFTLATLSNSDEVQDAAMVQSAQASLQSVVTQGAARMDLTPMALRDTYSGSILNELKASFRTKNTGNANVQFTPSGDSFLMNIPKAGRSATFKINNSGDVNLTSLSNFTSYKVFNGVISKI